MIVPMEYTHTGYQFLEKVNATQLHSGCDLNFGKPDDDLNKPVKAMANGVVVWSSDTGKGWGNLIVIYHSAYGVWTRYGHLNERRVKLGTKVLEGDIIGLCGNTGGTWGPHLHFDVIIKELPSWTKYTTLWSEAKVKEYYTNPLKFIRDNNQMDKIEQPIVKWHKENKIIEKWTNPPTVDDLRMGWAIYKGLKALKEGTLKFDL